jgi:hypothetical protein
MTDEAPPPVGQVKQSFPQQMPGAQPAPTFNAGHILIAAGINEISVMCGQTRLMGVAGLNNQNAALSFIEWFATITLSPTVAQQLRDGLDLTLKHYTDQFGPIPKAPPPKLATEEPPAVAAEVKKGRASKSK